jgi:hypothetical protein
LNGWVQVYHPNNFIPLEVANGDVWPECVYFGIQNEQGPHINYQLRKVGIQERQPFWWWILSIFMSFLLGVIVDRFGPRIWKRLKKKEPS